MGLGKECGAVTGAFMVIGLSIRQPKDEKDARFKAYDFVKRFKNRFEARHGTVMCRDLLGVDVGTSEGHEKAVKEKLYRTLCPDFVKTAAEVLVDLETVKGI
jgi:C_GCAxxG_C_C family probable redox protein